VQIQQLIIFKNFYKRHLILCLTCTDTLTDGRLQCTDMVTNLPLCILVVTETNTGRNVTMKEDQQQKIIFFT